MEYFDLFETPNLIIENVAIVVTMNGDKTSNNIDNRLGVMRNVDVIYEKGLLKAISPHVKAYTNQPNIRYIDGSKSLCMPALIDCHVHPYFMGSRAKETLQKIEGKTYTEIAANGGGIMNTVKATKNADNNDILRNFSLYTERMFAQGIIAAAPRTGYGLTVQSELLQFYNILNAPQSKYSKILSKPYFAPVFLGAHAHSPEYNNPKDYVLALTEVLNKISFYFKTCNVKNKLYNISIDMFIEKGYFEPNMVKEYIAKSLGEYFIDVHIHADEFSNAGGAELALEFAQKYNLIGNNNSKILSVDHCQFSPIEVLAKLSEYKVVSVALPSTSFFSDIPYVNGIKWRDNNVIAAIASDFNPGSSPSNNLWFAMYLALAKAKFSLAEIYEGVTINANLALGNYQSQLGKLQIGKNSPLISLIGTELEDIIACTMGEHVEYMIY